MLQRSDDWFQMRNSRFTASDIIRLLGKDGLKMTSQSIESYAFEKAVEAIYGKDEEESFISFDMQRGIDQEPLAFQKFKDIKELEFLEVEECSFFPYGEHAGASPDGLVGKNAILEIKNPKRVKFFKQIVDGIDGIDPKYIAQMQMQMLCTNSEHGYFFNYLIENGQEFWHEIFIPRDEIMIDLIKKRIEVGIELKLNFIEQLQKNKQFNH